MSIRLPLLLIVAGLAVAAADLDTALRRIDAASGDAEGRLAVSTAIAGRLKIHRNRVALLRRQTGRSYSQILVATLRERGASEQEIEREVLAVAEEVQSRGAEETAPRIGPVLTLTTAFDRSSAAAYYSVVPEAGIETPHAGLVFGAPLYRVTAGGTASQGIGDVYTAGYVRGKAAGLELGANLSVGFPTGDVALGLGAGKTSVDGRFTAARNFERGRVFASAGGSNFLFNNFIYQRPYISDGPAAHFSGGGEVYPARRLAIGVAAFAAQPSGTQTVATAPAPEPWQPPKSRGRGVPSRPTESPAPSGAAALVETPAADLADRGINGWATVALSRQVWLEFGVARSFPFELTTARIGLVFNIFGSAR